MQEGKGRVLCVEDDEDTCEMLKALLNLSGYEVKSARSKEDALRLTESESFDLYLLDNLLPDGNGIELCKQIRASDPLTPIIFLSGLAQEADREEALDAGAQAYLIKPVNVDELVNVITNSLDPDSHKL